jgi:hypothetical protein
VRVRNAEGVLHCGGICYPQGLVLGRHGEGAGPMNVHPVLSHQASQCFNALFLWKSFFMFVCLWC